ncbi:MAG: hypothetical protein IJK02_03245 [Clostridia bacterium]|nr:hypothetical protein [Clostridia bacterium]
MNAALANAEAVMDAIPTDAELTAQEALAAAKTAAKNDLDGYKNADDYRDAQKTELAAAIEAGKTAIDNADKTPEENNAAVDAILAQLDAMRAAQREADAAGSGSAAEESGKSTCPLCGKDHGSSLYEQLIGLIHMVIILLRWVQSGFAGLY